MRMTSEAKMMRIFNSLPAEKVIEIAEMAYLRNDEGAETVCDMALLNLENRMPAREFIELCNRISDL
jgi:hypothetical protein